MVEVIRDFYYRGIEIPRLQFRLKEIQHSYFEQKLDHFKATDQRTWSQVRKYVVCFSCLC